MTNQTAITEQPKQQSQLEHIKSVMLSPATKERFAEMMGTEAIYYLNQVMILVANTPKLQECAPTSILVSAMRAASLKLSVDPAQGQAWIIPYAGQATFQLGYRGVYELAMRTNLYRFINVPQIYEGEEVAEDRMTGMHSIQGKRTSDKIIGWMLYFEMFNGFKKTYYMTVAEIDDHAKKYSASYKLDKKSKWHDDRERPKMERKTVLVNGLRKWGRFNPGDQEIINQIEDEQPWVSRDGEVNAEFTDVTDQPESPKATAEELIEQLTGEKQTKAPAPAEDNQDVVDAPVEDPSGTLFPLESVPVAADYQAALKAAWTDTRVSYDTAATILDSDKVRYVDLDIEALSHKFNSLGKSLKENGLTDEVKAEKQLKRDVAAAIISAKRAIQDQAE